MSLKTTARLRLRKLPDTSSPIIDVMPVGELLTELDISGNWIKVKRANGQVGWSYGGYLLEVAETAPVVTVHAEPDTEIKETPSPIDAGIIKKVWIPYSGYTPLIANPAKSTIAKLDGINLNPHTVLELTTQKTVFAGGKTWQRVIYNDGKRNRGGYVDKARIEPHIKSLPTNCVDVSDIETESKIDAAQYVKWNGVTQYNMCGEMSLAYIFGVSLSELLTRWQRSDGTAQRLYKRIFGRGVAGGTGEDDLIEIARLFGREAYSLSKSIKAYTPQTMNDLIADNAGVIFSCNIDNRGVFVGRKILHWATAVSVWIDGTNNGTIDSYNSFHNGHQRNSWREFLNTTHAPYGVIIK